MVMDKPGRLYLVPTPIGNLQDITLRALSVLKEADLIACEDTRHTGRLLAHFGLEKRKISYFEHNETARTPQILAELEAGKTVAVVSDGGSPGLSDPAYRIVVAAIEHGVAVEALPGPTAVIPALTASGLPTDRFFFEGFLPVKPGRRRTRLEQLRGYAHTIILYESVHRIKKTMADVASVFGDRRVCIARELSKIHEEYLRGTAAEVAERIQAAVPRGEFVIVIAGSTDAEE
jgi:16S rRNA (cytidine1402-2'-O)-methyltransferase